MILCEFYASNGIAFCAIHKPCVDAGRLQYLYPTQLDVGVDNNNFTPLSFEQVRAKIIKQIETAKK